jgi:hypothetical protein
MITGSFHILSWRCGRSGVNRMYSTLGYVGPKSAGDVLTVTTRDSEIYLRLDNYRDVRQRVGAV